MVTFSLPGDGDAADAGRSTPRPRPALPFAKRAYVSTPYKASRLSGTPQSSRRLLTTRDEVPSSSLSKSSIATARNIFRVSAVADTPPVAPFSPSLPQSTMKKVFAPGATPEPSRTFRESTAQATPRGMASKATSKELFTMRIEDPDPELSGEALTRKIPKDWNSKGSIYADQFLSHLCPPDFDEEQRRQFFCILDLRRLKYAANEIFSNKDWKLNVVNFAKEFDKSRSIILLRYGLYEFQNVKPSKDVLKRWRREHGLPEPEEEEDAELTPTKSTASKKRKADDDISNDTIPTSNKRRAPEQDEKPMEVPTPVSVLGKNKRRVSVSDEAESQPSKMQKGQASMAKSLFEKIANKSSTPVGSPLKPSTKPTDEAGNAKPNPFAFNKPTSGGSGLARSVFQNLKPGNASAGGNIFGYLSDASSAKNSGVDADAESEADSDVEEDSQATAQSDEPSAAASGTETASQVGTGLFAPQAPTSGAVADISAPGTRESTPGRSLFDRVTKGSDGQPMRAEDKVEPEAPEQPAAKPADQTWNPTTTPIKFAPPTSTSQPSSLFGKTTSAPTSSLFAPKTTTTSNIFGAPKQDKPAEKESTPVSEQADITGGESDKENDQAPKKPLFEVKAPAAPPSFGSSLFTPKPTSDTPKEAEPIKPASSLFGAKLDDKASTPSTTNLFGSASKPAGSSGPVMESSTLFGAKPAESDKSSASQTPKTSLFGGESTTPAPLFGVKPTANATSLFGNSSTTTVAKPLFGAPSASSDASTAPKTDAPAADKPAAAPIFSFGAKPNGTSESAKPLFGTPKSPTSSGAALFDGSPMKQDAPSPAKKAFNGGSTGASAAPIFSFGSASATTAAPIFGGGAANTTNGANTSFGAASSTSNSGSGGFSFQSGNSGTSFNNPFASGNNGGNSGSGPAPTSGGMFNFGSTSTAPSGSSAFQFGSASGNTAAPAFGANQGSNSNPPSFGSASGSTGAPAFSFTGASPAQNSTSTFGSNQAAPAFGNLQPPAGGSTTGTSKSPFPHRKILPLKRRG